MIIYIHGFGSSGEGHKAKQFREYFKDDGFIAPSLSYIPDLAIKTLEELIESCFNKPIHSSIYHIKKSFRKCSLIS